MDIFYNCILWNIYLIVQLFISFFSYEHITNAEYVYENPSTFPAVSICNLRQYDTTQGSHFADIFQSNLASYPQSIETDITNATLNVVIQLL